MKQSYFLLLRIWLFNTLLNMPSSEEFLVRYGEKKNWRNIIYVWVILWVNTFKYHVFAPMGRFQLESIYLYFPPSSQLLHLCFCQDRNTNVTAGTTVENKGKLILTNIMGIGNTTHVPGNTETVTSTKLLKSTLFISHECLCAMRFIFNKLFPCNA